MNRIYRLVFNCTLRVWQVASELVRSKGGMVAGGGGVVAATVPKLRFAMWLSLGWVVLAPPVLAQQSAVHEVGRIVSDPDAPGNRRPTVLQAPNGVPLVNITTPSAAGVSRNAYRQFDVGTEGAILNNARTAVQTELGGRVQGNPWLAGGTARIILNEVNSAAPSHLHGYVEVAGGRAQVIIANPAGIQVDGGGFLNASRVTLSTGAPIFNGDALTGFRVESGAIRIDGAGLDATRTDYTGLIARATEVNAGIWAQQLQVTNGANTVSTDLSQVTATTGAAAFAPAPTLALDVSALGGMYAGKITLLGTEQGLGVRNAGTIGAQAGELTVTFDGRLENTGAMQSRDDLAITAAGGVANAGTLSASRELAIATPQALDNSGGTLNAARIQVDAQALQNRGGAIEQTGLQSFAITAGDVRNREGGRIGIADAGPTPDGPPGSGGSTGGGAPGGSDGTGGSNGAPGGGSGGGTIPLPGPLDSGALRIAGTLDNGGGRINAGGGIDLSSVNGLDNEAGRLGVRHLDVQGGDLSNRGGSIAISGVAGINVDRIDNAAGRIEAASMLTLGAQDFDNRSGSLVHSGTASTVMRVGGTLDNTDGTIASNAAALELITGVLVNEDGEIVHAGLEGLRIGTDELRGAGGRITTAGAAVLDAGFVDHRGAAFSAARLDASATQLDNRAGSIIVSGEDASRLYVVGRLGNDGGTIASTGSLELRAATFENAAGRVQHAGDGTLSIAVDTLDGAGGTIASNGRLSVSGDALDLRDGQTQARSIAVDGGDLTTAGGQLVASGDGALRLSLRGALDNDGGTVATNGALELAAASVSNRGGALQSAGTGQTTVLISDVLDNSNGVLVAAGDADIAASELRNAGGTLQAAGGLRIGAEGLLDNSADGLIAAAGDMAVEADVFDNTAGTIQHAGTGVLAIDARVLDGADGTIAGNGGLRLSGDTLNLRDGTSQARRIAVDGGDLTTAGGRLIASGGEALQLQLRGHLDNDSGTIVGNGALDLAAGSASNRDGTIQAAGDATTALRIAGAMDNTGGLIAAAGDTDIAAGTLRNVGGVLQAAGKSTLLVSVDGLLDNSADGLIVAGGDTTVAARTLDNTDGAIQHAGEGALVIDAGVLTGVGGTIVGNGRLALSGGTLDLRDGVTQARNIAVEAGSLNNAGGRLAASGEDALRLRLQGALNNDDGSIATNGALDLTASAASNRDGSLQAAGAADTWVRIAATFDNTGGVLAAQGNTAIAAGNLLNVGGVLQTAEDADLSVSVDGLLDNSNDGLIAAGGDMGLSADRLDNTDGTIQQAGSGALAIDTRALDGAGGTIASNGRLALTGDLNLRASTTQAHSIEIDGGDLTTADGRLIATGDEAMRLQLRGTLDNDAGTIATNGALNLTANAVSNRAGTLQAAGGGDTQVRVANTFDNTGGILAAVGNTTVDARNLLNAGGLVQAAGTSTLQLSVDGLLDNSADGLIVAGGDTTITADTLDNTDGAIQHAGEGALAINAEVLNGTRGTIAGNGSLTLSGGTLDLRDGTTQARAIAVDARSLTTAGGSLVASGEEALRLRLQGALDNDGGTIATNGALDLTAGAASNRGGTLQAAGTADTAVRVATTFDNTGGVFAAAGNTAIAAGSLRNAGGVLQAVDTARLHVSVDGLLENSGDGLIAAGGDMTIEADVLDNTDGAIQHAGAGTLAIDTRLVEGMGGTIAGNGSLALRGDTLNLRDGTTQAQRIEIDGGDLTTAGGRLIATSDEAMRLQLRGTLDNDAGTIATNGALNLSANAVSNRAGTLQAAGDGATQIRVANTFDNTGGILAAVGNTTVDAGNLLNAGGLVQAAGTSTLRLSVNGLLDNSDEGLVVGGGDTTIAAGTLDNTDGAIQHAGHGTLAINAGVLNGSRGTIVGNGSLALSGGTLDLRDGTTQARAITVDARSLTTAGGSLVASGEEALRLRLQGALDNDGGTIATNGALDLTAGAASNRGGTLQAAGTAATAVRVTTTFDNTGGVFAAAGDTTIAAGSLRNAGGVVQAIDTATLYVSVDGLLDNSSDGLIAAGGDMTVEADVLDNTAGTIQHAGSGVLAIDARVLDGRAGTIAGNGSLALRGDTLNLRHGTTQAQRIEIDGGDLTTADGRLIATGDEAMRLQLRGTLDNDAGTIATNGALHLAANAVSNRAGTLQAAGDGATQIRVANTFDNTGGILAAVGNTTVAARNLLNAGGLVQAAGTSTLQLSINGLLDNSADGLIVAGGDTTITADTLDNTRGAIQHAGEGVLAIDARVLDVTSGTIAGNGALVLSGETTNLRGGTTTARTISVETGALTTAGGALVATGNDVLRLGVRGMFDNAGGTVATNGGLDLEAAALDNRDGRIQTAGAAAALVRVAGTVDNSGGLLATAGATTLRAGELLNVGGALAATADAPLAVTIDGRLLNDGGSIESNGDISLQSQSLSNVDGIVRTQQAISATVAAVLDNSRGTMIAGSDLTVRAGTLRNQNTFDAAVTASAAQRGLFGDRVALDAMTIDNTRGQINAGNGLVLTGGTLANAGGRIDGTGTVDVSVASLTNAGGRLTQRGNADDLNLFVSGTLDNSSGFVGADGNATLRAHQLDNTSGIVFAARHLDIVSQGDLHNRANGLLQSNADLTLTAGGTFDNSGGQVDATGAATLAVGRLANVGGQLLAGIAGQPDIGLNVVSGSDVDNRGGTIGSRGGDLALHASTIDNSGQGRLVANRDLALHTQSVNNTSGTVYAGRDLTWQNGSGVLVNNGGRFGAGDTARLSVAQVHNRDGGRIQADTLWLDAPTLHNAGGEVTANTLHAQLSVLGGAGRIYGAEWLNLHFNGDFTYAAGNRMEADGRFGLTVTGTFTNQGTLQSVGELALTAGNVINDTGGTINASNASGTGVNRITATGSIENRSGASLAGDTLLLTARDVVNTGDIVGNKVGIDVNTLTNGRDRGGTTTGRDYAEGFIGAADLLELRIGQRLSNLDGELYSGGNLLITGRADGARLGRLENVSGRIQAGQDLDIAADAVVNERRVVLTEHRAYVGDEQFNDPDAGSRYESGAPGSVYEQFCRNDGRTHCSYFSAETRYQDRVLEGTRVLAASAAAQLLSGRDMRIDTGSVDNRYSQIAAGQRLTISGRTSSDGSDPSSWSGVVNNVALAGYKVIQSSGTAEVQYQRCSVQYSCQFEPNFRTVDLGSTAWRKDVFLLGGSITAGGSVNIIGGDISNTVVRAGDGLAAIGPGSVGGPGNLDLGASRTSSASRLGNVDAASGAGVSAGGSVDTVAAHAVDGGGRLSAAEGRTVAGGGTVNDVGGQSVTSLTGLEAVEKDSVAGGNAMDSVDGQGVAALTGLESVKRDSISGGSDVHSVDGQGVTALAGLQAVAAGTVSGGNGIGGAAAGNVATRAVPEGAAAQVVGGPERPLPGLVPPDNGMFDIVADPNAPFLVKTAPRFVPGDTTGSDYLLDRMGASTDQHKRLGDAAYEQRLVLEQLMALTGRRALDGSDGLGQYRMLMENASQVADDLGLLLGSPLTVTQIGALDQDIVWLVEQVIDGQKVLVPVVYLSRATAERLRGDNALIAGGDVKIQSSTTVRNDGTLEANQGLWLSADTLINDGTLRGGKRLDIATMGDTVNRGELIGGSVSVDTGRDVLNTGSIVANTGSAVVIAGRDFVQSADGRMSAAADGVVAAGRDLTLQASANAVGGHSVSRIDAGGDLALVAGRDLTLQASRLAAGDNVVVQAGQDLRLEALSNTQTFAGNRSSGSVTTHQVVDIRAGGDTALSAGRDALLQGSRVDAAGALALVAGRDIDIQAVVDERSVESQGAVRRGSYQRSEFDQTVRGAELTAGSDIAIVGGRDVTLDAAYVGSQAGGVAIGAGRDLSLIAAEEQHNFEQTTQTKKSGFLSSKRTTTYDRVDETLAVGTTISGNAIQLTAGNDLTVTGSVVLADRDVRIAAGNNVTIESAQDTLYEAHSSSQKRSGFSGGFSGGVASIGYGKSSSSTQNTLAATTQVGSAVGSLDGNLIVSAGNQLTIAASDLAAGQNLTLAAEDILLEARQDTIDSRGTQSSKSSGYSLGITYDPGAAYRSARDNATGGDPGSGSTMGELTRTADGMAAGSKAALTPVVVRGGSQRASGAWGDSTSDARVSQLVAGGDLTLLASDGSITSQGAQMSAEGDALLLASRNIVFDVAHNTESRGQDSARTGWSIDNSAALPVGMNRQQGDGTGYSDTITGTQLSVGGNAALRTTEGDIALTGSNIVAEGNVDLHAAGNLSIRSGQDTAGNANRSDDKAIGTVVISDTERFSGYHTERYNGEGAQVSQVASSVGSLGGDLRMSAGGTYTQQASHVVAAGAVDITAATIDITTADDINSGSQQNKDFKFGVFARVNSPLIALVNNVDAARQSDGRLQAMQGMAAAANAYQTASAISSMAGGAGSGSLVSAEAGVGVATSQHQSQFNERLSQGSTISGGGDVSLTTTEGDLRISQGSLSAGNTLSLDSAKDLILEAGQSQVGDQSRGSNAGVEVGVGVSVGAQTGVYAYAQANVGSHRSNSDSTTYQDTQLTGQTINLSSGGDTTLRGATATAETINLATGDDLTIESLQDIAQSQSKDSNVGGRVQVSLGTAWSASGNASQSSAGGNYAGVGQQSGLFAGDGGYHVNVGGAVNLVGGAIASTNAGNSELTAAELSFSDLQNSMGYQASSASLGGGYGSNDDGTGNWVRNVGFDGSLPLQQSGDDATLTRATLTEGRITIGGTNTTAAELGLNTDASKAHQQLQDLPDLQKMLAEQRAMADAAGTVVSTSRQAAGDLAAHAQYQAAQAEAAYWNGLDEGEQARLAGLTPEKWQEHLRENSPEYRDAAASQQNWGIGGDYSRALNAVTTVFVGGMSGQGTNQLATNTLAPYAAQLIGERFDGNHGSDPNQAAQLLGHALLGALLAEVNGGNATGGALVGAGGELAAIYLTNHLFGDDPRAIDPITGKFNPNLLSEVDKQTVSALSQAVGAIAGGMAGGTLSDALLGAGVVRNAVENNFLSKSDVEQLSEQLKLCATTDHVCRREVVDDAQRRSDINNDRIKACTTVKCIDDFMPEIFDGARNFHLLYAADAASKNVEKIAFGSIANIQTKGLLTAANMAAGLPKFSDSTMLRDVFIRNVDDFAYTPGHTGTAYQQAFDMYEGVFGGTKQPHEYSTILGACHTTMTVTCGNAASQFDALRRFAGPGTDGARLATNGAVSFLSIGASLGYVTHLIDPSTSSLINITVPGAHALDPGFVVRQIVPDGRGGFSVSTRGWGTGSSPVNNSNSWAADFVWAPNTNDIGRDVWRGKWPWQDLPKQERCVTSRNVDGTPVQVCQ